jgi:hypothetical protein
MWLEFPRAPRKEMTFETSLCEISLYLWRDASGQGIQSIGMNRCSGSRIEPFPKNKAAEKS